jgi:hypothetical protein
MSVFHPIIDAILHNPRTWRVRLPLFVSVIAGLMIVLKTRRKNTLNTIPSPRTTLLPRLSPSEVAALPYWPDVLPGGRWVDSPYGAIRVYEWGSEHGRKVLVLHGISNPSPVLGGLANGLVERGCRVMLIGRLFPASRKRRFVEKLQLLQSLLLTFLHISRPMGQRLFRLSR